VRELESAIERAVLLCKGDRIDSQNLPFTSAGPVTSGTPAEDLLIPSELTLDELEREAIIQALKRTKGNKQAAARALGIYRPRLYSKIKKYNLTEYF
jgi:DNA-binding NtrC family response regulator